MSFAYEKSFVTFSMYSSLRQWGIMASHISFLSFLRI